MELFSLDSEHSVIGGLLIQPDAFDQIHWLSPARFYESANRKIFTCIAAMLSEGKALDVITLAETLEKNGELATVGGLPYLTSLMQNTPGAANIRRYAEVIQERGIARDLLAAVHDIQHDLMSPGDIKDKLDRAQSSVMAITEQSQTSEPVFVRDLLPSRMDRIEAAQDGKLKTFSTGLADLDNQLGGGIEPSALVIVAARPSMGKTALAVQLAEAMQNPDEAALVFSCEMANGQVVDRMISGASKVSSERLRTGKLTDEDWTGLTVALGKLNSINMLVDDKAFTLNAMRAKARTVKRKYGLSCIVVDYIQLMDQHGDIREQQVAAISRGLKSLAKELEVPVIALSQLSRKVEERASKEPIMSDLRESGAIEQDADVIMFIYRDEYYNPDSPYAGTAKVIVGKNRNGRTGSVLLHFDGEHTRFGNHSGQVIEMRPVKKSRGFD